MTVSQGSSEDLHGAKTMSFSDDESVGQEASDIFDQLLN